MRRAPILLLAPVHAACSTGGESIPDDAGADVVEDASIDASDASDSTAGDVADAKPEVDAPADVADAACPGAQVRCDGACVDTKTDEKHCGACGTACPTGSTCTSGKCASGTACTGAGCVSATTCPGGASEGSYLSQAVPTGPIAPGASVDVSVTFANCGTRTWNAVPMASTSGFKLGSQAPQDNMTWGTNRVVLPADVPPKNAVKIPFTIKAPATPGSYAFSWQLVNEGVAWVPSASPSTSLKVEAPAKTVTLCAGVTADASGTTGAAAAIQKCIDATPSGGTLALPAGTYRIDAQLGIRHPMTLSTEGLSTSTTSCLDGVACAVLQAAPDLDVANGMLAITGTDRVLIDHVVLDGNRGARLGGAAASTCASGNNRHGFNAMNSGAADCAFTYSASIRALCGTGFEWRGDRATITHSVFRDNGDNATKNLWADGLTLLQSDGAVVTNNRFENNSDVSFICGGAKSATFKDNVFLQSTQVTFAAFMLDNFNGGTSGDFTGTTASAFTISCTAQRCHFGVQIGPHPWYLSANTIGGTVTGMTVDGARQGLNVEGGGTAAAPVKVYGNVLTGSPTSATFNCGSHATSLYNVSADSFVDHAGDKTAYTTMTWHSCP